MNRVVRHAIAQGLKPVTAIQMATLNAAQHFRLDREIGSIAPGRLADLLIVSDLPALVIDAVFARGVLMAEHGRLVADIPPYDYPASAKNTVKLGKVPTAADFGRRSTGGLPRTSPPTLRRRWKSRDLPFLAASRPSWGGFAPFATGL